MARRVLHSRESMLHVNPHPGRVLRIAAILLVSIFPIACVDDDPPTAPSAGSPRPSPSPGSGPTDAEVISFVDRMNEHRVSQGLSPLAWHSGVAAVATAHSQDMENRDFFSHTNPDGDGPGDRLDAAGITYRAWGENIAWGYATGASVLSAWLASSGHRANIENGYFTHHGVGKVGTIWTHVFLRPSSSSAAGAPVTTSAPPPIRKHEQER
ncbi:MAG TPA: CAP domain-containing protein [Candidatus Eisenbacteria bacterium]|nr:CAP domain-containing protein [Candidatus Eisenbacteria bacterium]